MLEYQKKLYGEAAVFALGGKPDLASLAALRKVFWECVHEDRITRLIIDLKALEVLDAASISLLVATKNMVQKSRACLILTGIEQSGHDLLRRTHLNRFFDIRSSLESILEESSKANETNSIPNKESDSNPQKES